MFLHIHIKNVLVHTIASNSKQYLTFLHLQEFDHPYKLLMNQKSYFYELVSKTGSFVAAALTGIAREVNFFQLNLILISDM